jgi:hypothetical protein
MESIRVEQVAIGQKLLSGVARLEAFAEEGAPQAFRHVEIGSEDVVHTPSGKRCGKGSVMFSLRWGGAAPV